MNVDELYQAIQELPEEVRSQAEDFVLFLRDRHKPVLGEEEFWGLIGLIDLKQEKDEAAVEPLTTALAKTDSRFMEHFEDKMAEKLSLLDGPRYLEQAGKGLSGSSDSFLYARCFVLANGESYYNKVLNDPSLFPANDWLESLLFVARKAYESKYGEEWDYFSTTDYETGSNETLWDKKKVTPKVTASVER